MEWLINGISIICLLGGCFFVLTGSIGLIRFPSFYTRLHAASLTDTMGCLLIILGLILQAGWSLISIKLFFIVVFILFTSPVATYALNRSARHGGVDPEQS